MAFTIEEAYRDTKDQYQLQFLAGKEGSAHNISWVYQLEDPFLIEHFWGDELVITLGIGFRTTSDLMALIEKLHKHNAAGLIINTGEFITTIEQSVLDYCNEIHFPLLTVPWEIMMIDLIKDYCLRTYSTEEQEKNLAKAFIDAIETPGLIDLYKKPISQSFNIDGTFQVAAISSPHPEVLTTITRRRILFQIKNYLEKSHFISHLFWYDEAYILVANDVAEEVFYEVLENICDDIKKRIPEFEFYIGLGTPVKGIESFSHSFKRSAAAFHMCQLRETYITRFADMGIYQLLFTIEDKKLLQEMYENTMAKIIAYDQAHHGSYEETLYYYLKYNGAISQIGDALFTHRNTVLYRIKKIKELLGNDLETAEDRFPYQLAFYIRDIKEKE